MLTLGKLTKIQHDLCSLYFGKKIFFFFNTPYLANLTREKILQVKFYFLLWQEKKIASLLLNSENGETKNSLWLATWYKNRIENRDPANHSVG